MEKFRLEKGELTAEWKRGSVNIKAKRGLVRVRKDWQQKRRFGL